MYDEQLKLEKEAVQKAKTKVESTFIDILESGRFTESPVGAKLLRISIDSVTDNIKQLFNAPLRGQNRKLLEKLKMFFEGREQELAYIILNSTISAVALKPKGLINLAKTVIKDIDSVVQVERFKEDNPKAYSYIEYEYRKRGKKFINKRKKAMAVLKGFEGMELEGKITVGTYLIDCIIKSGTNILSVMNSQQREMNRIGLSSQAMKIISMYHNNIVPSCFTYTPLVYPPSKPTSLIGSGGYLSYSDIPLIKRKKEHLNMIKNDLKADHPIMNILDTIQQTPWSINTRVYDVMEHIIEHNIVDPESPKSNPYLFGGIPYMEYLSADNMIDKESFGRMKDGKFVELEDYKRWYSARDEQDSIIQRIISKRLIYVLAMDIAKKYKKYDKFYFTYQFDYRYRLYPLQQHLNPQATGNIKSLLQFKRGCVLNDEGLYWLKIHGANCYGYDKLSYEERIQKVEEMHEEILFVAEQPLDALELWSKTDSPFEYLAFCFSYSDYVANPNSIIYTPVALDATCSGIQVYSGLMRDETGAKAVNVKGKNREDIYQDVADVGNQLLADGEYVQQINFTDKAGEMRSLTTEKEARGLQGKITRTLTKRNVMTTPYSVTKRGMYEQVKELLDDDELNGNVWWKGDKWVVAKLIADVNERAIGKVVKGAIVGQQYIKDITANIASENKYLRWLSPVFKLPMIQRIPKEKVSRIRTPFGKLLFYTPTKDINKAKMLSSIAPNFIHQLDAVLMYLTVQKCMEYGVRSYWLIHDSYGVLPNDVPDLAYNVREAYIELFSINILEEWTEQLGVEFDADIMINTLDLDEVRESEYIFS